MSNKRVYSGTDKCSFCQKANPTVAVSSSGALLERHTCLAHYYTTNAVRNTKALRVLNYDEVNAQLKDMQSIFAEAFVELQKDIAEALARDESIDPLSALTKSSGSVLKLKKKKSMFARDLAKGNVVQIKSSYEKEEEISGGFFKQKVTPDKLIRLEQDQSKNSVFKAMIPDDTTTNKTSSKSSIQFNPYNRRKTKRVSYWNIGEDNEDKKVKAPDKPREQNETNYFQTECSCGSNDIIIEGNMGGRNDISKGETWGSKEKPDVFERCRCNRCGKVWNEE